MGHIDRQPKGGGTTSYTSEVLAVPNKKIIAAEVDEDFDQLYSTINNLDHANLNASAGILGTQLADGTIPAVKITSHVIGPTQLAFGAGVRTEVEGTGIPAIGISTTETVVVELASMAVTGGRVLLFGALGLSVSTFTVVSSAVLFNLYRDGTLIGSVAHAAGNALSGAFIYPLATPTWTDSPGAGSHIYRLKVVTLNANLTVQVNAAAPGKFFAVEFA